MKFAKIDTNLFDSNKIKTQVILESKFTKEIIIYLSKGQIMKEHQTPFPIVVHLLVGKIDFGVQGQNYPMITNDLIALDGGVSHNLIAKEDAIIRLTLSLQDSVERVQYVVQP